jgi:DNA-directed RNA polymerase alpha subunit
MADSQKRAKICDKGHTFYKSSDCPTCPICAQENKPESGFLSRLSSPARNALLHNKITTLEQLSKYTEKDILKLHGMGPTSMPILKKALQENGLSFM